MKLISISSNKSSFKTVQFKDGFNVVLAEITDESQEKDSRNGLGKTTLIEIIHFLFGADVKEKRTIGSPELKSWEFSLELILDSKNIKVTRSLNDSSFLVIEGEVHQWFELDPSLDNIYKVTVNDWKIFLGEKLFDLPKKWTNEKFTPTFRSLFSYYARIGIGAYENPFKFFPQQSAWQKQINNSFLLNLNWEYAREFQLLKDRENTILNIVNAKESEVLGELMGSEGELEAVKVNVEKDVRELEEQLENFHIHPEYEKIKNDADSITQEMHDLINERNINRSLLSDYLKNINSENPPDSDDVLKLYESLGVEFSKMITESIDKVFEFHKSLIENRQDYLKSEINKLESLINKQSSRIENLALKRADYLKVLETQGALDEYTSLQIRLTDKKHELNKIKDRLSLLDDLENQKYNLKIKLSELVLKTRQDLKERKIFLEQAISIFNNCSQFLYSEPGTLSVDVTESGYKFEVDIKRAKSEGYGKMKIFSYDFTHYEMGLMGDRKCPLLIHDSTIFDGVDERQIAKSIEYSIKKCEDLNSQYICTMNSDLIPTHLFEEIINQKFDDGIVLTLKDDVPKNSLLGIRF